MTVFNGYLALGTMNALGVFTEITGANGYARQAVTLDSAKYGLVANTNKVTFPLNAGSQWPLYNAYAIYDKATGGSMQMAWRTRQEKGIKTGKRARQLEAGDIWIEIPGPTSKEGSEVVLSKPFLWTPGGLQRFEDSPLTIGSTTRALGEVLGEYAYAQFRAPKSNVIPAKHLTQFAAACANVVNSASGVGVNVVIMGDSTHTENANNAIARSENLFGAIKRRIREDNPGVSITFHDRAIGGTTWNDAKNIPNFAGGISAPSWYTNTAQAWIDTYVAPLKPDLIVMGWGTNDTYAIAAANVKAVFDKIGNSTLFPVVPDVVLDIPHGHKPDNSELHQNGYQMAAGLLRSIALGGVNLTGNTTYTKRIGMIDIGRLDAMMRLGFDPCSQYMEQVIPTDTEYGLSAFPFTFPECDGDFDLQMTFVGGGNSFFTGNTMTLTVAPATNGGNDLSRFRLSQSGTITPQSLLPGNSVTGTALTITGDPVVRVNYKQGHLYATLNNTVLFDRMVARAGGKHSPLLTFNNFPASGVVMRINRYSVGRNLPVKRILTDELMWGTGRPEIGGNGINHESSYGAMAMIQAALDATRFDV